MTPITAGTPLEAPRGFLNLEAGQAYHFIRSSPKTQLVMLIRFVQRPTQDVTHKSKTRPHRRITPLPLPLLVRLPRSEFEHGLRLGHIIPGARKSLPPWLESLEGHNLEAFDDGRASCVRTHRDRIDDKLIAINALTMRSEEILDDQDIERTINAHARSLSPAQNETRVRLWFFVFIAFGRQRTALHYPVHRIGHWDRMANASLTKRGAPGHKGPGHGHNTTAGMREMILASYQRESGLGITDEAIYNAAMRKDFGCATREIRRGKWRMLETYHPEGKPFPQKDAYFYHVRLQFGGLKVQAARKGKNRARSEINPGLGSFSEHTWNLMQRVEADAYRVKELPKGFVSGSDLRPLVVVSKRDTMSGLITGIGFWQGSEVGNAYRMATFCEAIGLRAYLRLFGLKPRRNVVNRKGISPHDVKDRGPGATLNGLPRDASLLPIVSELAPAQAGQGKAIVETSHPKTAGNDEAPSFVRSNRSVIDLVKKQIYKILTFNDCTNMQSRINPDIFDMVSCPSPNGLCEALMALGRDDAVQVSFEEAVRGYLDIVPANLKRSGLEMLGRNYYSKAGAFQEAMATATESIPVKVYVLSACVRHVWFDWKGQLLELDVRFSSPGSLEDMHMSLNELQDFSAQVEEQRRLFKLHARAAKQDWAADYEEQTGDRWDSEQRVAGRPKHGRAISRQEEMEAREAISGRMRA